MLGSVIVYITRQPKLPGFDSYQPGAANDAPGCSCDSGPACGLSREWTDIPAETWTMGMKNCQDEVVVVVVVVVRFNRHRVVKRIMRWRQVTG